jgi:hypothetical protein
MTDIKRISLASLAPLLILYAPPASMAEETVLKRTTVIESTGRSGPGSTSVSVTASKTYSLKFKERLGNLSKQNDTAKEKGWINDTEYANFNAEIARLTALEAKVEAAGFPKPDLDDLEKQVTKLNSDLSSASNKPKKAATTTTTTSTATKKTAAGDTKKKTTTTTKTTAPTKK